MSTIRLLPRRSFLRWPRSRFAAAVAIVTVVLLASCSSSVAPAVDLGPVPPGPFTTDATGYVAYKLEGSLPRYQFRIISRFENQGTATVYLGRCFPNSPQPLFSVVSTSTVESGYSQVWACVGHDRQFAIRAGEVRVDT